MMFTSGGGKPVPAAGKGAKVFPTKKGAGTARGGAKPVPAAGKTDGVAFQDTDMDEGNSMSRAPSFKGKMGTSVMSGALRKRAKGY